MSLYLSQMRKKVRSKVLEYSLGQLVCVARTACLCVARTVCLCVARAACLCVARTVCLCVARTVWLAVVVTQSRYAPPGSTMKWRRHGTISRARCHPSTRPRPKRQGLHHHLCLDDFVSESLYTPARALDSLTSRGSRHLQLLSPHSRAAKAVARQHPRKVPHHHLHADRQT